MNENVNINVFNVDVDVNVKLNLNDTDNVTDSGLYNDVNFTCAVIGRCPWSIKVQLHGWRHRKLVFFVLFNMARGFQNVCDIISDWPSERLEKSLSGAIYKKEKMEKRRQKEFTTEFYVIM